jgi:hypothetical protein
MQKVLADVEHTSKQLKRFGKEVAELSRPFLLGVAGFVAAAAKQNNAMANSVEHLKRTFMKGAADIGMAFLPVVNRIGAELDRLVAAFEHLSPSVKAQIAHWAALGAEISIGAMVFSKVAGAVSAAAQGFGFALKAIQAIQAAGKVYALPFLAGAAAIAGTILLVGALRQAWDANMFGMQDTARGVWTSIAGYASKFAEVIGTVVKKAKDLFFDFLRWLLDKFGSLFKKLHIDVSGALDFGKDLVNWGDQLFTPEGLKSLMDDAESLYKSAKAVGENAADAIKKSWNEGLKTLGIDSLLQKLGAFKSTITGMFSGSGGAVSGPGGSGDYMQQIGHAYRIGSLTSTATGGAEVQNRQAEAFNNVVGSMTSRLGDLNDLMSSAAQGMEAGGPWGALAAVVADLLTRAKVFVDFVSKVGALIAKLADAIGILIGPLLRPVFELLKLVAEAIVGFVKGLIHAFSWVAGLFGGHVSTHEIDDAFKDLANATYDNIDATQGATAAVNDFAEALTNVPEGFKVALARFNAQDPASSVPAPSPVSSGGASYTPGGTGLNDSRYGITINVHGVTDPDEVADRVAQVLSDKVGRATGRGYTSTMGASRFAQEY